jgi:hypothetical protein
LGQKGKEIGFLTFCQFTKESDWHWHADLFLSHRALPEFFRVILKLKVLSQLVNPEMFARFRPQGAPGPVLLGTTGDTQFADALPSLCQIFA